ncbi:mbt repeat protein, partial [Ostertagia ostertagi]
TEKFDWNDYLQQSGAIAAPESLFRPIPDQKYMDHFQIGAKLESSDMCENHLVCPATVAAHKGRLLQIHFDGWEDSYDQLFDVQRHVMSCRLIRHHAFPRDVLEMSTSSRQRSEWWLSSSFAENLMYFSGSSLQYNRLTYVFMPPKFVADRWLSDGEEALSKHIQSTMIPLQHVRTLRKHFEDDRKRMITDTKFKVNDRVELLDYNNSTRVRPARVKRVVGRRICVHVKEEDFDGEVDEEDRQFGEDSEFWVDQSSFYLFHVGWASYNNYGLGCTKEYRKHAQKIAEALSKGEDPPFAPSDVTPAKLRSLEYQQGMRFELMDPLAQMFNELRVASSVLEVLKGGYLRVGMDGPDVESECIPLHCTSAFMFPVGYAEKYNIKLGGPNDTEKFDWNDYLQQSGAIAAPESLFRPIPDQKYMDHFQIGAKLESSDMCENHLVCPATVAAHKGRLLQIHFDGWEDSYDQLFDVHSSDIFPSWLVRNARVQA